MTWTDQDTAPVLQTIGVVPAAAWAVAGHLVLFEIGGAFIWASAFGLVVVVALVCWGALAVTLLAEAVLSVGRTTRRLGAGLIIGSLIAGALQVVFAFALLAAYSSANPGWDLS